MLVAARVLPALRLVPELKQALEHYKKDLSGANARLYLGWLLFLTLRRFFNNIT